MNDAGLCYLDHAASTPMRAAALAAMMPHLTESYANPTGSHRFARAAREAIDEARDTVAAVVGCKPGEVVFTGGGTESDNMALHGAALADAARPRLVCPATEHHAVLQTVERHAGTVIATDGSARVDVDALVAALDDDVAAVSVMAVNNEVGSINDLAAVAAATAEHAPGALVHSDAIQATSWLDLRNVWPHTDLLSLSGHKFGGPKGVGALIVRTGRVLTPLLVGGGQERERRSGTHNVAGIAGFAAAIVEADAERSDTVSRVAALRNRLVDGLAAGLDDIHETVGRDQKVAGSAHVCFGGVESESLLYLLDRAGVCASAASSCASGAISVSHVLTAMGVAPEWARGAVRMTLGRTTTVADVDRAVDVATDAVATLRARTSARSAERASAP